MADMNERWTSRTPAPSTAELVRTGTEQMSRLMRDELALAKAEIAKKARNAGAGAGLVTSGVVVAAYGIAVVLAAAVLGLAVVLPAWLSALIVAVVLLLTAALLTVAGRERLRAATPAVPTETARSVMADLDMMRGRTRR